MKNNIKKVIIGLEVSCLVSLLFLCGYSVVSFGTTGFIQQMGFAVGMSAEVPSNQYNTLAQSLKERDIVITEKERALGEKEAELLREQKTQNERISFLILGIGIFLFALILINFYFDMKRKRNEGYVVKIQNQNRR